MKTDAYRNIDAILCLSAANWRKAIAPNPGIFVKKASDSSAIPLALLVAVAIHAGNLHIAPAKADLFCYPGEQNCKVDGRIGTSGNDIFGNSGGDTIQKGAALLDSALGGGGIIQNKVNQIYETNKRGILDCVGTAIAPSLPGFAAQAINTMPCEQGSASTSIIPIGSAQTIPSVMGTVQMGGWQVPNYPKSGMIQAAPFAAPMQGIGLPAMPMPGIGIPMIGIPGIPMTH